MYCGRQPPPGKEGLLLALVSYIIDYYVQLRFGLSYVLTQFVIIGGIVVLLSPKLHSGWDLLQRIDEGLLLWMLNVVLCSVCYALFDATYETYFVLPLLLVVAMLYYRHMPLFSRVLYVLMYYAVQMSSLTLSATVGRLYDEFLGGGFPVSALSQTAFLLGFALLLRNSKTRSYEGVPILYSMPLLLIVLIHITMNWLTGRMGMIMLNSFISYNDLVDLSYIVVEISAFTIYRYMEGEVQRRSEIQALREKEERGAAVMSMVESSIDHLKSIRHDMKNNYAYMRLLLDNGQYQELDAYLEQYNSELFDPISFSLCGNLTVDYVLSMEIHKAQQLGIQVKHRLSLASSLPVNDTDLCNLLTNALDNAIESVARNEGLSEEERVISVSILQERGSLLVHVANPAENSYTGDITASPTSKANPDLHGYGTKIIDRIVKRYCGARHSFQKDGTFVLDLMLSLSTGEAETVQSGQPCKRTQKGTAV